VTRLSKLTIQARIGLSFAICIVIVAALVAFNYVTLDRLRTLQDEGATRARDAVNVQEMEGMANTLYVAIADTAINLDFNQSAARWRDTKSETTADLARLDTIIDTAEERARAREARAAFEKIVGLYEGQLLPTLTTARAVTPEVRALEGQIDEQLQAMRTASAAIVASLTKESEQGDADFDARATSAVWWASVLSLTGIGTLMAVVIVLVRDIKKALGAMAVSLRSSAQQVVSASAQVAGASQALSQGATEQAASLEETSASMEEMASMTRKNAENAAQAAAEIAQTERLTSSADTALADLVSTMTAIGESSAKVTRIIKTIDEIAFQTNILALNAAVEAARAGEAGMGFAVVADEVRNLAQRSATAAKDTAALIEESSEAAGAGETKVDAVVSVVKSIAQSSALVKNLVDEVSLASRQQAQGIDQVAQAITQMEKVTQTTAATAEESAAASEELNAQAEQSMEAVQQLEAMVGGASTPRPMPIAVPKPAGKVIAMRRHQPAASSPKPTAEQAIPFDDTGTFGSF
jgi:methyl-accepting chemotaxis protein